MTSRFDDEKMKGKINKYLLHIIPFFNLPRPPVVQIFFIVPSTILSTPSHISSQNIQHKIKHNNMYSCELKN